MLNLLLSNSSLKESVYFMASFDIVSEFNNVELNNAIAHANKEIANRFDFKNSDATIDRNEDELYLLAEDEFRVKQVKEILLTKLAKCGVDLQVLSTDSKIEKVSGDKIRCTLFLQQGIKQELAKKNY